MKQLQRLEYRCPSNSGLRRFFAGGEALPILYVSGTQINVVIPYDLMPDNPVSIARAARFRHLGSGAD